MWEHSVMSNSKVWLVTRAYIASQQRTIIIYRSDKTEEEDIEPLGTRNYGMANI